MTSPQISQWFSERILTSFLPPLAPDHARSKAARTMRSSNPDAYRKSIVGESNRIAASKFTWSVCLWRGILVDFILRLVLVQSVIQQSLVTFARPAVRRCARYANLFVCARNGTRCAYFGQKKAAARGGRFYIQNLQLLLSQCRHCLLFVSQSRGSRRSQYPTRGCLR